MKDLNIYGSDEESTMCKYISVRAIVRPSAKRDTTPPPKERLDIIYMNVIRIIKNKFE
jgi:hypothetical protein